MARLRGREMSGDLEAAKTRQPGRQAGQASAEERFPPPRARASLQRKVLLRLSPSLTLGSLGSPPQTLSRAPGEVQGAWEDRAGKRPLPAVGGLCVTGTGLSPHGQAGPIFSMRT